MKSSRVFVHRWLASSLAFLVAGSLCRAASDVWDGEVDGTWANGQNWVGNGTPPGLGHTATFDGAGNGRTTIDLGAGVTVGAVVFDTVNAAAYTIGAGGAGAQTLSFSGASPVTMTATVGNPQRFDADLVLGTATGGTFAVSNVHTTHVLTIAGDIRGGIGGTPGLRILNATGVGAVTVTGAITAGGATGLGLRNTWSGTLTLAGEATNVLADLRATNQGGLVVVDGPTVTVTGSSSYGGTGTGNTGRFDLRSGSVSFNGGINTAGTASDGSMIRV